MTKEDAIYWIKNLAVLATEKDMLQIEEALNMAIEALADRKTEPTISKMEQVETMSCAECKHRPIGAEICEEPCHYEPHYDAEEVAKDINRRVDMVKKEWSARHIEDEPQTERSE